MKRFAQYLSQVKAEEALKEKTKAFVMNAYENKEGQALDVNSGRTKEKEIFTMKKIFSVAVAMVACAVIGLGGLNYYNNPVGYISFDINPSVELGVNAFDRVVSAEGVNEDGKGLLEKNNLKNMSLESAVQVLVQESAQQGYIADNGSTVIALTALADNQEKAVLLQNQTRDSVQEFIRNQEMECTLYVDHENLQLREQAQEAGLSPGKFKLIEILQALDPSITTEQYRHAKITEIIVKANALLGSAETVTPQLGEYERNRNMITATAQQIMNREKNQNQNQLQAPLNGENQQEQNQIQDQNQIKTQNQVQSQTTPETNNDTTNSDGQNSNTTNAGSGGSSSTSGGEGSGTGGETGATNSSRKEEIDR